jgi:hypothetical protein
VSTRGALLAAEPRGAELRAHAAFPAALSTRERGECRSPLGALPGGRYVVRKPDGERPGAPVGLERRRGDALVSRRERAIVQQPSEAEEKR